MNFISRCGVVTLTHEQVDRAIHRGYLKCPICKEVHDSLKSLMAQVQPIGDIDVGSIYRRDI